MDQITVGTCQFNATSFSIGQTSVIVNDVTWNPPNAGITCDGRGTSFLIKCVRNHGLEPASSELEIILLVFCLLLLLISTSLFYKVKKDKRYYQGKIEALKKENAGAISNDPKYPNA